MNHQPPNPNVQKAVAFCQQAGLSCLLAKLREKYVELGQVGGQVVLEDSTAGERREIASFLGKPPNRDANLRVRLVDVERRFSGRWTSAVTPLAPVTGMAICATRYESGDKPGISNGYLRFRESPGI